MSLFVEVFSLEKGCPVILNLDFVIEIAPIRDGTTAIFYADSAAVGGKTSIKVKDSYELFKQFVMTPVSAEDIARRFPPKQKEEAPVTDIIKPTVAKIKVESFKEANKPKTGSQGPSTTSGALS